MKKNGIKKILAAMLALTMMFTIFGGIGAVYAVTEEEIAEAVQIFSDLYQIPTGIPSILFLYERGIINGMGDGTFNPRGNVTREQFVRLLLIALDIVDDNAVSSFEDVDPNAWYHRYVATIEALGLTTGIGNNLFGIGMYITRQDIAVFIYRSLEMFDIPFPVLNEPFDFLDEYAFYPYARGPVEVLQMSGIITGFQDGTFGPRLHAMRAHTSAMIHRLILVLE